ncbi:hypothetical protein BC827DRAFT_1247097 [Russula dissimulans]|nr:hypothetical protein BC827DRAFT_1247097 [Russula dissimulans]
MIIDTCPQMLPFSILNAFTNRLDGGNPAAIVYLPSLTALSDVTLQTIATNFNQPITVFIAPLAPGKRIDDHSGTTAATFGIRWFTTKVEVGLCGHGTLAAAGAVFHGHGRFLVARRVEEDRVEIELDSETSEGLSGEEDTKLREVLSNALDKNVPVSYTGRGAGHLNDYALIKVDTLDLKNVKVNSDAFVTREPFPSACHRCAVVCPRCHIRVSDVCTACWGRGGSGMWHSALISNAVLDGREQSLWHCLCKTGQRAWG